MGSILYCGDCGQDYRIFVRDGEISVSCDCELADPDSFLAELRDRVDELEKDYSNDPYRPYLN